MQIDLIDMRHMPHNGQKHIVDHWSKFHLALPTTSKSAVDVAHVLQKHVFPVFGLPNILHSDNGCEFVNKLIGDGCFHVAWSSAVVVHVLHNPKA